MRFFEHYIKELRAEGHIVDLATNEQGSNVPEGLIAIGCKVYHIGFSRNPISLSNYYAIGQLKKIITDGKYELVHCHTPNASAVARLACKRLRKTGVKIFYTAHGFHFYKGAPIKNWLIYYPIEKVMSHFTDKIITINNEDYHLSNKHFGSKRTFFVHGVGIDTGKCEGLTVDKERKRLEIGVPAHCTLILSVGELNDNKNQEVVIRAIKKTEDKTIHYAIAGSGTGKDYLENLIKKLNVEDQVHLLGYRTDILELNYSADVFCLPSKREGLSVALMEAMACHLPCVVSRIRGNVDLIDENGGELFDPMNVDECADAINAVRNRNLKKMGEYNAEKVKQYDYLTVEKELRELYYGKE